MCVSTTQLHAWINWVQHPIFIYAWTEKYKSEKSVHAHIGVHEAHWNISLGVSTQLFVFPKESINDEAPLESSLSIFEQLSRFIKNCLWTILYA